MGMDTPQKAPRRSQRNEEADAVGAEEPTATTTEPTETPGARRSARLSARTSAAEAEAGAALPATKSNRSRAVSRRAESDDEGDEPTLIKGIATAKPGPWSNATTASVVVAIVGSVVAVGALCVILLATTRWVATPMGAAVVARAKEQTAGAVAWMKRIDDATRRSAEDFGRWISGTVSSGAGSAPVVTAETTAEAAAAAAADAAVEATVDVADKAGVSPEMSAAFREAMMAEIQRRASAKALTEAAKRLSETDPARAAMLPKVKASHLDAMDLISAVRAQMAKAAAQAGSEHGERVGAAVGALPLA